MKTKTQSKSAVAEQVARYNESPFDCTGDIEKLMEWTPVPRPFECRDWQNIMVEGEPGVGKETWTEGYARALGCDIVERVNCAALPETAAAACSWLFGCEKGSYTGAPSKGSPGVLGQHKEKGRVVVFLDEVGKLPREAQGGLLRLLQFREVQKYGGKPEKVQGEWRIVLAAQSTRQCIPDLEARCNVVTIPALRYDVRGLLRMVVAGLVNRGTAMNAEISEKWLWRLLAKRWPGNRRELEKHIAAVGVRSGDDDVIGDPAEEYVCRSMFGTGKLEPWSRGDKLWDVRACGRKAYAEAGLTDERLDGLEVPSGLQRAETIKLWQAWDYDPPLNDGGQWARVPAGAWYEQYDKWAAVLERRRDTMIAAWERARGDEYYKRAQTVVRRELEAKGQAGKVGKENFAEYVKD